ncbi:MAG: QueT transporter family protein [Clostridium sp.]|jgi:uncharacterized membrane protein|nr:QueT transporter family protein [Clostridium sp.]
MNHNHVQNLTRSALVAAIYVVLTLGIAPISYGPVQFRVAEILNLLAFFNPIYIVAVSVGCFISNLFSPFGLYDVFFGTLHTALALILIWKSKNLVLASFWPAILSFIIAFELNLVLNTPFLETWIYVGVSEIIITTLIAVPVFTILRQSGFLQRFIVAPKFNKEPKPAHRSI